MLKIAVSLLPVFLFLLALILIDSYKLLKFRDVLMAILMGCLVAVACFFINSSLSESWFIDPKYLQRYVAPVIEELLKALYLAYLIKSHKVGFMVDAAIYGVAIGAGFSLVENIYYLRTLSDPNLLLWIIRGFGTALMHGGTVALFGIIAKGLTDRGFRGFTRAVLSGLGVAIGMHSIFNHFILPPHISTLVLLVVLPAAIVFVFDRSEKATRGWLGSGFDTDMELLELIGQGGISETRIGRYLESMKRNFPGEIVADMLCLLRLHLELAIRAKGILMLRATGFEVKEDPETREKFAELQYLEKSLGKTGKLAIHPLLHTSSRDLWQLYMLNK